MKNFNIRDIGSFSLLFINLLTQGMRIRDLRLDQLEDKLVEYYEPLVSNKGHAKHLAYIAYNRFLNGNLDVHHAGVIMEALNIRIDIAISRLEDAAPNIEVGAPYPSIWDQKIDALGLQPRTENVLLTESIHGQPANGLDYVGQLVSKSTLELREYPGLGSAGIQDIISRLAAVGQKLNTDTGGWKPPAAESTIDYERFSLPISALSELVGYIGGTLKNNSIEFIGDLVRMKPEDLDAIPGIGKVSQEKILAALKKRGLELGMDVGYWRPNKK
jgi:DNA-directed RNA polymerase alpha subunit